MASLASIPVVTAASQDNEKKVAVCHATSSKDNPYVSNEPAIGNNGDLQGGHLTHTGPVYPTAGWGDIIPPYDYVDSGGKLQSFPGYNWEPAGQAIWQHDCNAPAPPEPPGSGSIEVVKNLSPTDDPGRFNLKIGETEKSGVGHGGTTGEVTVEPGSHEVSESAASGTSLSDYTISTVCRDNKNGAFVAQASGSSVSVPVAANQAITCTITNIAKAEADTVIPRLECVDFRDGAQDVAYWGYENTNSHPVSIPIGNQNRFRPDPEPRGQPTMFEAGRVVGQFSTRFEASTPLTWDLSGNTATASASSPRCTATVELRKVVQPATDPGTFVLAINGEPKATGGNGTTTGPIVVGTGEGTVSETAGPGTNLADYDSRVDCTRNGSAALSVTGTKADGAVASGDVVVCTFTNTRRATPSPPTPPGSPVLDLEIVKSARPTVARIGDRITWTMVVTNRSTVAAADVNGVRVDDPRSVRTKRISLKTSQGTCRPYRCDLGRLAPGASATVVAVTEATRVGPIVNIVRVWSEEKESNYRNNIAVAIVNVVAPFSVNRCHTLVAEPRALQSGRSSVVRLTARNALGRPAAGISVRARGAGVDRRVVTNGQGVARVTVTPAQLGLLHFVGSPRTLVGGGSPCRTLLGVLGAEDTIVTG